MLPYQGQIFYQNKELGKYRSRQYLRQVGQVFQTASDQFLTITVNDEIALALKHSSWSAEQAQAALKQLELDQHQEQVVYSLSGGQQRKLQLLLMLMAGQEVLLVDEPLSGLDHDSRRTVLDLLSHCHKTLIIISHQLAGLAEICDYHLQLDQQQLTYVEA
jgi:energy-coupling factor transporter ATP-binding protein EcfA2